MCIPACLAPKEAREGVREPGIGFTDSHVSVGTRNGISVLCKNMWPEPVSQLSSTPSYLLWRWDLDMLARLAQKEAQMLYLLILPSRRGYRYTLLCPAIGSFIFHFAFVVLNCLTWSH